MKIAEADIPATIKGWESEGQARVELLASMENLSLGQIVVVGVRPDAKGRKASDFSFHNKQGLRVGGMVLMRKLRSEDGIATCRSVEPITMRDTDGASFVMQDAAVCILPPAEGTVIVKECLVAMLGDAIPARSLSEGITKIMPQLDAPAVFGIPGLAFFGKIKSGDPVDVIVGAEPDSRLSQKDLVAAMLSGCPKDVIKESRTTGTSRTPWMICPIFRAPIDPDRSSKLSAQATNHSYGTAQNPMWTRGVVILRTIANQWHVSDASPIPESAGNATKLASLPAR